MASKMAVAPSRGALARKTSVKTARRTGLIRVRAVGPAYDEVFDGTTGQMEKVLSQSVESLSAGGLEWSYRVGVPEEGTEAKPTKVIMVHGAGLNSFTYNELSRELQTAWAKARRLTCTNSRILATSSHSPRRPSPSTRHLTSAATVKPPAPRWKPP